MATRISPDEFLRNLSDSGLFSPQEVNRAAEAPAADGAALAQRLVASGKLTLFQAEAVSQRRFEELVIGNYEVLDRLGAGGMGTVYKARHRRMKRIVAVKVLSRAVAASGKFVQRFQREVEAAARLSHPNIVLAYDADEADVGHFLVMEFVDGCDLATEVQKRGRLPVAEAVSCIVQAARALAYAHTQGIIHRDIKPANLLRDQSGVVKVADLGLARVNDPAAQSDDEAASLTQAGTILGTVDYMSPEQAMGQPNIDARADVYSLGCTLYYLLAGQPPYRGTTLTAVLLQHRDAPIPSLCAVRTEVPAEVDQLFRRMVAKKADERFGSMAEVARAFESLTLTPEVRPKPPDATQEVLLSTTVEVILQQPAPGPVLGQTVEVPPARQTTVTRMTILLVEPSRTQASIIRTYLQELGFADVTTAPSGQKALESARTAPPVVVISAMHLADMTGVQLVQRMRAEAALAACGFVLITSQSDLQEANLLSQAEHTVRLTKPFDRDHLAQALAVVSGGRLASRLQPAEAGTPTGRRVLLVDDSAAARSHVRGVLTGLGLSDIVEAIDGAEAVARLEKETFDLVVTDYNMPRLDGRALIEFIRQRSPLPSVPVIMVTTETDPVRLEAVRRLGVAAICDKSFKPDVVRAVLERLG